MRWHWPRNSSLVRLFARRAAPAQERARNIYALEPGQPFLSSLAEGLLRGDLPVPGGRPPDPLQLADITLYLPSRRLVRPLQEAFLRVKPGAALLLPKIKAISEGSEDLDLILGVDQLNAAGDVHLPRTISELERHLVLTTLTLKWGKSQEQDTKRGSRISPYAAAGARTPAQAAHLARELARLMDELEAENVDLDRLKGLVPDEHSEHWSRTLAFLGIVTEFWPAHLAEHNLISPAARRRRLVGAEIERLLRAPPVAPVIVAGVTHADPAARDLIKAVTDLPNGALVLPALDQALDDKAWLSIADHPEHPQFGLKELLDALGLSRSEVRPVAKLKAASISRARWSTLCEAMRPAATTDEWHRFTASADKKVMAAALTGLSLFEASSADEEAEAISLVLREVAETPGRTAMLVVPDRMLARRVSARLAVWGLRVEDMGGEPFARTPVGSFLDLVATAMEKQFEPVALMALLRHPLCRLGLPRDQFRRGAQALELAVFRAPYFGKGLQDVAAALQHAQSRNWQHKAVRRLASDDWLAARALLERLQQAFEPMVEAARSQETGLQTLARAHFQTALALSATGDAGGHALQQGEAGEWASQLFASLIDPNMPAPVLSARDYPDFYRTLVADKRFRPVATHPRLRICDPFEARLQQADVVVLGALNEGTWPRAADPGPWLNRPMREVLGLPAPEETIGAAAHDFDALLLAPRVVLTRAAKVDGAPTVPSRWLLRLQALVDGMGLSLEPEQPWLAWAQQRSAIAKVHAARVPEPRPPVSARPRTLSVTAIEKWIANPYAIFAQRILGLDPLPLLGAPPAPSLRGQIIHEALGRFAQRFPGELPRDVARQLTALAKEVLTDYLGNPRIAAFWAPRFGRFAEWFAETEPARRSSLAGTLPEVKGKLVLDAPAGPFNLTARADRIDCCPTGLIITDYKTAQGVTTLATRAVEGRAPQLPLEAAIAAAGGFDGVPAGAVKHLRYISTSGGEPPGQDIALRTDNVGQLADDALVGLRRLVSAFDHEDTPYRAMRRLKFNYDYDDFAHLARVAEWQAETEEED